MENWGGKRGVQWSSGLSKSALPLPPLWTALIGTHPFPSLANTVAWMISLQEWKSVFKWGLENFTREEMWIQLTKWTSRAGSWGAGNLVQGGSWCCQSTCWAFLNWTSLHDNIQRGELFLKASSNLPGLEINKPHFGRVLPDKTYYAALAQFSHWLQHRKTSLTKRFGETAGS